MMIPGPAGGLQAEFTVAEPTRSSAAPAPVQTAAVLCHPHPQYGGSMHDAVLACAETALLAARISCLRFNFRGVGASEGSYSGGPGELEDLHASVDWLRDSHAPELLYLVGYSFGAAIVWQALATIRPQRALLIAPPVAVMSFTAADAPVPVDIFAGDRDDYVDPARLTDLGGSRVHMLAGADHFFSGCAEALEARIASVLATERPGVAGA